MLSIFKLRVEWVLNESLLGLAILAVSGSPPHVICCRFAHERKILFSQ